MAIDDPRTSTQDPLSRLLWQPGRKLEDSESLDPPPEPQTTPSAAQLEAYRRSELKSPEREAVEDALIRDPRLRAQLAQLSDLEPAVAPDSARERALAAFEQQFADAQQAVGKDEVEDEAIDRSKVLPWRQTTPSAPKTGTAPSRSRSLRPAWAALAAAILAAVVWIGSPTEPLPQDLHWQIQAQGQAVVRSHGDAAKIPNTKLLELAPSTVLRLDASPSHAIGDIEVGLFRLREAGSAERLPLTDSMLTLDRGAARIEASTGELLGSEPESGWLILVFSRSGAEPSSAEINAALRSSDSADISPATVVRADWRAHPIRYRISDSRVRNLRPGD